MPEPKAAQSMLEYALGYWMDFKPVFPICTPTGPGRCIQHGACRSAGKTPLAPWLKYQTELPSADELDIWWNKRWPEANIGMATGHLSGVVVLDLDGTEARKEALRRGISPSPTIFTGKVGGTHIWLRDPGPGAELRNFARKLPGIDFRGEGGYVVLPPSRHESGRQYRWADGTVSLPLSDIPAWLLALFSGPGEAPDGTLGHVNLDLILDGIPEGQRDDTIYRYACKLRGDDVPRDYAEMLVRQAARSCRPPFDESAAVEKVQRAYREFAPTPVLDVPAEGVALPGHESIDLELQPQDVDVPGRPCTQLGNAERLMDQYGNRLRYCYDWKSWLIWDGRRWRKDNLGQVVAWAELVVRSINTEVAAAETRQQRRAMRAWAATCEKAAQIAAMIELAKPHAAVTPDLFDTSPWLLNVQNGTIDLRTGLIREHRQSDNLTKLIDLAYHADAVCPRWDAFLGRVLPDQEVRAFFQRAAGYSATGSARERKLIIPHGNGKNGKSVALQALKNVLGEYAVATPPELFMVQREGGGKETEIAALLGARFVFSSETNEGGHLAESVIKRLTGGESVSARFLYGNHFSFLPTFTPWLATNHRPVIRGSDHAIWDRIALLPFSVRIPDDEQDQDLPDKLQAEAPGILAWVVRGTQAWLASGLGAPAAVQQATGAYRAEMDTLGTFIAERCVQDSDPRTGWVSSGVLYAAYTQWCSDSGERSPLAKRTLGMRLEERGYTSTRVGATQARGWLGLRLLSDTEELEV